MSQDSGLDPSIDPALERTATVLVVDTSGSMGEEVSPAADEEPRPRIEQINEGMSFFKEEIIEMEEVKREIDVSVVTFGGGVTVEQEFTPIIDWEPPVLSESGRTPMGGAIEKALDLVDDRKEAYKQEGIAYKRPFVWVLTDGKPTDMKPNSEKWENIHDRIQTGENGKHFALFIMAVGQGAKEAISPLHPERTLALEDGKFREYFEFLSSSVEQVSSTEDDDDIDLSEEAGEFEEIFQL
ncbi:vWA domain-containing protein [Halohasta salina]|uniref:vWA domain-containing protein n=1 Tax=Halohasta salina TaxID=2961621 RepID=UPI0020A570CC|nr:VWA domain-containing protein [Halohasta salina]